MSGMSGKLPSLYGDRQRIRRIRRAENNLDQNLRFFQGGTIPIERSGMPQNRYFMEFF